MDALVPPELIAGHRVLVHSYFPPLADHLAGGAQHALRGMLDGLVRLGVKVDVVCPPPVAGRPLDLGPDLRIFADLVEPGEAPLTPTERHRNLRHIAALAVRADVVVTVDRAFPLPVPQPVVLLLNNFSYGTEVDSVFSFGWDSMIVPSDFLRRSVDQVAGPAFWHDGGRPIAVLPPAVDLDQLQPCDGTTVRAALGLTPEDRCLLFPHRPDPGKGFAAALTVLCKLRARGHPFRLLVPAPPQSVRAVCRREAAFMRSFARLACIAGMGDAVVVHDWIAYHDLASYYSLGECTLMLSTLPEGFGLAPLHSVACGTPVVATPAGAVPDLLPPGFGIRLVDFHDVDGIVEAVLHPPSRFEVDQGRDRISRRNDPGRLAVAVARHLRAAVKSSARYDPHAHGWSVSDGRVVAGHAPHVRVTAS